MCATRSLTCHIAQTADDVRRCQALRHQCFHGAKGIDADGFDAVSDHVMIEMAGQLVCTLRMRVLPVGADVTQTYTGQFYDFGPFEGAALEIGRFCVRQDAFSADVLRLAWAVMTRHVDQENATHLFGCASFAGLDPQRHADAFAILHNSHARNVNIAAKDIETKQLSSVMSLHPDRRAAMVQMPVLLRSYLGMGGYVSDALIVDATMDTLIVFAGLRIADIPPARVRSLRNLADQTMGLHKPAPRNS